MEDIANRPACPYCGALKIVGVNGWEHPYPRCRTLVLKAAGVDEALDTPDPEGEGRTLAEWRAHLL